MQKEDGAIPKKKKIEYVDREAIKADKEKDRTIKKLKYKKYRQEERKAVLERLQKAQQPIDMKYFKSSAKLGQSQSTKRESLKRALLEERAGLERSEPTLALYQEREQVVDFTIPAPIDNSTNQFLAEHGHQLQSKSPKKKKAKTAKPAHAQRKLKAQLFSRIESSSSDSEGDKRRKSLRDQHKGDASEDSSSSISDLSDSEDSTRAKSAPQQSSPALDAGSESSDESSSEHVASANTSTAQPKTTTSTAAFVIPTFAAPNRTSKSTLSTASSTRRRLERRGVIELTVATEAPKQTAGFVIPNFAKPAASDYASGSDDDGSIQDMAVDEHPDISESGDLEDEDMRKRHNQFPERAKQQFAEMAPQGSAERPSLRALTEEAPEEQRKAAPAVTKYFVKVERRAEVEATRRVLPILMEEHQVMEAIRNNDFVIICGETGSGKTTQVPQFLYEEGYGDPDSPTPGMIGVTEPRRVAAISTAQRVAYELNQLQPGAAIEALEVKAPEPGDVPAKTSAASKPSDETSESIAAPSTKHVAYQVRYDVTSDRNTRIKFMTDGILLREIQRDFLLNTYSVIVIDEAHERTMNTDLLLGLLCRLVPLRNELFAEGSNNVKSPLKVVIMSATLRVSDFVENHRMFPGKKPPVIKISARQFPVTIHFNRRTSLEKYVQDAYKKVVKIHTKLPAGGILVFLAGQAEILELVGMLRKRFIGAGASAAPSHEEEDKELFDFDKDIELPDEELIDDLDDDSEESLDGSVSYERGTDASSSESSDEEDDSVDMDAKLKPSHAPLRENQMEVESSSSEEPQAASPKAEESKKQKKLVREKFDQEAVNKTMNVLVMPLYSMLSPKDQMRIFGSLPENTRLIVVATNIAETSLTIPGISYVVDAGRVKSKVYEKDTGMTSYRVAWTSQASADQRAGRAGRTGPGHCYRLFSSAVFQTFNDFSAPDILNVPIEGVVLQMKHMGIDRLETFPFPTPPDTESLDTAHSSLLSLGALELQQHDDDNSPVSVKEAQATDFKITPLGRALVHFPVAPRYAKMLIIANQSKCLSWIVAIVAALSVGDPFNHSAQGQEINDNRNPHKGIWKAWASSTSDLLVWLAAIGAYEYATNQDAFCEHYKLLFKIMKEIRLLREQLHGILSFIFRDSDSLTATIAPISTMEEDLDAEEVAIQEKLRQAKESESRSHQQPSFNSKSWHGKHKANFDPKLEKPSNEQNLQIRQIIASGLLDHIARRYPMLDEQGVIIKNRFEYRTVGAQKVCTIHPHSFLRSSPPEYVAYNELIETHEAFIVGVTAVSMGWMSDLAPWMCKKLEVVLPLPKPRFDEAKDTVLGAVEPRFVHDDWIMPKIMTPLQGLDLYKHMARCLLEGELCEVLKQFGPFLNASPDIIFKVWTQPKIAAIVQPLVDKKIKSRRALFQLWTTQPDFLLGPFALWLDKAKHSALKALWPPLPAALKAQISESSVSTSAPKNRLATKSSASGIPSFGSSKPLKRK